MTNSLGDKNLTRERLRQLISAAKQHMTAEQAKVDATEYDWQEPHHFRSEELAGLKSFSKRLESRIGTALDGLCQVQFEVTAGSVTQQFTRSLAEKITKEMPDNYFLTFMTDNDRPSGFITVSTETAVAIVGHVLRDSNITASEDKKLSELEESILTDALGTLIESISTEFEKSGCSPIHKASQFIKGQWPFATLGIEDLTSIDFEIKHADGELQVKLTIFSYLAEPALGMKSGPESEVSDEKTYSAIMQKAHKVPIEVTAQLCSASMTLNDIMSLSSGNVLLLEQKVRDPLKVLFNGRKGFMGYPSQSSGKYAVVIAPITNE
jgi:flagellar motor switch protein FliM